MERVVHLQSQQDASQNFIVEAPDGGFFESRLVQRDPEKVICYLSSHSGCNLSCRFCHLTATKQTTMFEASMGDYVRQATRVLDAYAKKVAEGQPKASRINFNFMARGEPLENTTIRERAHVLFELLEQLAKRQGLSPRFKISTIMPRTFNGDLAQIFAKPNVDLYYSLYSMHPRFRKRWMAKAMDPNAALDQITEMQSKLGRQIVLHWASIAGENDGLLDAHEIVRAVKDRGLDARFNLVRYNPYDERYGVETPAADLSILFNYIKSELDKGDFHGPSKVIPRVGPDVAASCGMFITKQHLAMP